MIKTIHGHDYHENYKYLLVYQNGQLFCRTYNMVDDFKKEYTELLNREDIKILGVYENIGDKGVINLLCQ